MLNVERKTCPSPSHVFCIISYRVSFLLKAGHSRGTGIIHHGRNIYSFQLSRFFTCWTVKERHVPLPYMLFCSISFIFGLTPELFIKWLRTKIYLFYLVPVIHRTFITLLPLSINHFSLHQSTLSSLPHLPSPLASLILPSLIFHPSSPHTATPSQSNRSSPTHLLPYHFTHILFT